MISEYSRSPHLPISIKRPSLVVLEENFHDINFSAVRVVKYRNSPNLFLLFNNFGKSRNINFSTIEHSRKLAKGGEMKEFSV